MSSGAHLRLVIGRLHMISSGSDVSGSDVGAIDFV